MPRSGVTYVIQCATEGVCGVYGDGNGRRYLEGVAYHVDINVEAADNELGAWVATA